MADRESLLHISYQASAASWPFVATSTTLYAMKAYSRFVLQRNALGWDDLVISISWVFDIVRIATLQKALGSTRRITNANLVDTVPAAAFWVIFADAWAFLSIALPKLGVGILIIRIFRPQPWLRASIMALCIALNVFAVVGFIITFAQCHPAEGQWDPFTHPEVTCWERSIQIIYSCIVGGISAFTDIAFTIYPCFIIWGLQMPKWKKLSTMALMSLGLASFAFAVVKIVANTSLIGNPDMNKLLNRGIYIGIWNSIENDFVLSAACLPSVPPLFRECSHVLSKYTSSSRPMKYGTSYTSTKPTGKHVGPRDTWELELARYDELENSRESNKQKSNTTVHGSE